MPSHNNDPNFDFKKSFDEIYNSFKNAFSEALNTLILLWHELSNAAAKRREVLWNWIKTSFTYVYDSVGDGLSWIFYRLIVPFAISGINVLGYFVDKLLFGPSGLREALQDNWKLDSLESPQSEDPSFNAGFPAEWRAWIRTNAGWDIYETMSVVTDYVAGFTLGLGIGLVNHGYHLFASLVKNSWNYSTLLEDYSVFGRKSKIKDDRHIGIKLVYGLLSLPIVAPLTVVSNTIDLIGAITHNFGLSFYRNLKTTYNLLGENGILGERQKLDDPRGLPAKIFYGILSAPFVAIAASFTNAFDLACAVTYNSGLSFYRNLKATYNLLGENGVLGKRNDLNDSRGLPAKIVYAILSAPFVAIAASLTNAFDLACAVTYNFGLSFYRNLKATYNLLGENGVLGIRSDLDDSRGLPAKIVYGILSSPFLAIAASLANAFDLACAVTYNFGLSFYRNLKATYNLLGENGVLGKRNDLDDSRGLAAKIAYGILSAPFVAIAVSLSNAFDLICAALYNFGLSFYRNLKATYNLLGENGVLGIRNELDDSRGLPAKIVYGILSAPFLAIAASLTNAFDLICAALYNFGLSFYRNLKAIYNLLGENGVFGKRNDLDDSRGLPAKIVYGILSVPFVAIAAIATNAFDLVCATHYNIGLSFYRNLKVTYNLLGENGVFGKRNDLDDSRGLSAKIAYGILSAPFVVIAAIATNAFDLVCAAHYNFGLSFYRNLKATYNLLGKNGVFGKRNDLDDSRGLPAKIVYGILSAPFVVTAAIAANIVDLVCTAQYNIGLSFYRNLKATYNLLGKDGVLGNTQPFEDSRELPAKIIYGIFSAPFVAIAASLTNAFDFVCAMPENVGLSFYQNLKVTYNLLGENGVLGKRQDFEDSRGLPAKIIYGILATPLTVIAASLTNAFDIACIITFNIGLSFFQNLKVTYNLLGENGVFGQRHDFEDSRGLPAKIIYGILAIPLVVIAASLTNAFDVACIVTSNLGLSFYLNLKATYNLLDIDGFLDEPKLFKDSRGLATKIFYGILSAPFVAIVASLFNFCCVGYSFICNFSESFKQNLNVTYNLLGENGVFGAREDFKDSRRLPIKIIYGVLSSPFVAFAAVLTNTVDLIASYFAHWKTTIKTPALITSGVVAAVVFAIPAFAFRKLINGLYNVFIQPFIDSQHGKEFNAGRFLRGVTNVCTLGLFSAITKLFKAATGYSHRFGFTTDETQIKFREACHHAERGSFDSDVFGKLRIFTRTLYGMRHTSEKIVKTYHNAYLDYAEETKGEPNMNGFFASNQYTNAKNMEVRDDEKPIIQEVENFLTSRSR